MAGLTLDGGALIGFERQERRVLTHLKAALAEGMDLTVPAAVIAEVWRGGPRSARVARLLSSCVVEDVDDAIDALVMASAAQRGDRVLTSDVHDLARLRPAFPGVRVVGLS